MIFNNDVLTSDPINAVLTNIRNSFQKL